MKRLLGILLGLSFGTAAYAVLASPGDVFVGGGPGSGTIKHYSSAGVLLQTIATGTGAEQTGMAFDSAGILYATAFGPSTIQRFDTNGVIIAPNPFVTNDVGSHNESIVFANNGNFYVGQPDGTHDIIKRDASGAFLARYDVAIAGRGTDWIDLAADQKTMFYAGEGRIISRYDVSTSTQLADFATLPGSGNAFALRLLSDGGLLIADSSNVKRLNAAGAVITTYDTATEDFFFALNLDPDGTTFWTAGYNSGTVYRFNIATGALVSSFATGGGVSGLAVFGERTQGNPGGVPDAGSSLALLAVGLLSLVGARRYLMAPRA